MLDSFSQCQLFHGLSIKEKEECLQDIQVQFKNYKKGNPIVFANEAVIQQLILIEGEAKGEMTDYNGKTIKIADMKAPKLLAPGFLFGQDSLYPVSIVAKTDCSIAAINKTHFLESLLKHQQLQKNFLNIISNQTQFLTRKINFLSFKTIKGNIAHFLLKQYTKAGHSEIILPQSQAQLAELFGVARPSLSRAFSELNHDGIIQMEGKKILILDVSGLKGYLD